MAGRSAPLRGSRRPGATSTHSGAIAFAIHTWPFASRQMPSGARMPSLAQTRRFDSVPSGADIERREPHCERFGDDHRAAVRRDHAAVREMHARRRHVHAAIRVDPRQLRRRVVRNHAFDPARLQLLIQVEAKIADIRAPVRVDDHVVRVIRRDHQTGLRARSRRPDRHAAAAAGALRPPAGRPSGSQPSPDGWSSMIQLGPDRAGRRRSTSPRGRRSR